MPDTRDLQLQRLGPLTPFPRPMALLSPRIALVGFASMGAPWGPSLPP
ncbi:hypothetical protein HNR46_000398 [Haloferula luteola]|uniref:Uncharacterized protein n=1 Tax=Haloferula luteola TaxID=595692 RepID=A0A840UVF7_9BACT|nr:hypothetical protein [Haloferula luteola]